MSWDELQLSDLSAIATILPLPQGTSEALTGLQPQALMSQLTIDYANSGDTPKWRLSGQLSNLQLQPWNGIPGIQNLSGQFDAHQNGGALPAR